MSRKLLFLCIVCVLFSIQSICYGAALPYPFKILPQPRSITLLNGKGLDLGTLNQLSLSGEQKPPIVGDILSRLIVTKASGRGTLKLILDENLANIPSSEGYQMTINETNVEIKAKGDAGLFYGCQSLEQLLEDARDFKKPIPPCIITDYPELSYRAVHFDVKHHLDHMNYYYASIDRLSRYKINAIVFEFEDKLRYQRQPLVGAPQAISIDEMAALTAYARERHIEITPLVQGLGHASFILKHEAFTGLRELAWNHWAFCPLNEGTYQLLFDLYRDAIQATPGSKYLHIGGDEIGNIGQCPRCKPTADKEGMMSLNLYWLKRVCAFAQENNRIPIFWDDMPFQHAGTYRSTWNDEVTSEEAATAWRKGTADLDSLLKDFPKNCVYMRWNYSMARQPGNILALDWYQSRGLKPMIATATNAEGGFLFQSDERDKGKASSGIISIQSFIQLTAEKKIGGMLCTAWDDKSPHMENYWRGFIAAAEYSWSPQGRTLNEYDEAWLQKEFGLSVPDYKQLNDALRKGSELYYDAFFKKGNLFDEDNTLQSTKQVEHWLPPVPGREYLYFDFTTKLIDLPDPDAPSMWSKKYKVKLDRAREVADQYSALTERLQTLSNHSIRNKYYWKLSAALNDFQITTPRLLLAIQQWDTADKNNRNQYGGQIKNALMDFDKAWQALQLVYSETRFISDPPNYVPDRYFHLASQREDMTWMIQACELYHGLIRKLID